MKENLILEDRNYISAKRAAEIFSYTSDYVGQLCRGGKLECKMIGRSWFVTKESLIKYQTTVSAIQTNPLVQELQSQISEIQNTPKIEKEKVVTQIPVAPLITSSHEIRATQIKIKKAADEIAKNNSSYISNANHNNNKNIPTRKFSTKITIATALSIVVLFFTLQSFYPNASIFEKISYYSNSIVSSVSKNITDLPDYYANIFSGAKDVVVNKFNGFVVALSSKSTNQDQVTINNIKNSFSDDVKIKPNATGESGVIIPVFRKTNGDDFLYVLVPVKDSKKAN